MGRDDTLEAQRLLGKALRLSWTKRATRGFFLRAEDFFGFTKRLARERAELMQEMREAAQQYKASGRSQTALGLKQGPLAASLAEMEQPYGAELDANSHGQSFLKLFQSRFVPGGLYLLDDRAHPGGWTRLRHGDPPSYREKGPHIPYRVPVRVNTLSAVTWFRRG